ncbi:hypothetical protein SIAM614_20730 [Stappia aggregata IAM 12614]|uniref:Uncharacterized protein n=1 Tax=Roseibium aggregatum (strain ATCC 25650 / DSM 13394 / JCM 20685 / NBRC 16684 / NCIMB 2208 / IAM 12614 / B1) TaxID=384765 RepID=A0NYF7_ROSAI|nr:hypothetical protein SIAM614_20730 [Stappia aggregata IAM 12614] [Roseibium aggregatum IAM 12614]
MQEPAVGTLQAMGICFSRQVLDRSKQQQMVD